MNILLTNDDGIDSEGIRQLAAALSGLGDIFVSAPMEQRSACGHGITIHEPVQRKAVSFAGAKAAYAVDGTPADCVKMGIIFLGNEGIHIDAVFSGINHGANLGTDALYSGTVSAALEGAICGRPSVAVSIESRNPTHYEMAAELAAWAFGALPRLGGRTEQPIVLSINTPDLPKSAIKGTRVARLGLREYDEWFKEEIGENGESLYTYAGQPLFPNVSDINLDICAAQDGFATVTPLQYDLTSYALLADVEKLL